MKLLQHLAVVLAAVLTALAADPPLPGWAFTNTMNGLSLKQPSKLSKASTVDSPTPRFSRLKHIKGPVNPASGLSLATRQVRDATDDTHPQNISAVGGFSTQYAIECTWDGLPVSLLFDTGSSDTWAIAEDFECVGGLGNVVDQADCKFGSQFVNDFAHGEIEGTHFSLQYGSGEEVWGPMGYSDLSCGSLSVSKQQVGLANHTYWRGGNKVTVGILGMAYPSITSAFYGDLGDEASWNSKAYSPFLTTAIGQGTMEPLFSVAIMKNSSDGILAWGGLPPIPYNRCKNATADLLIANLIGEDDTASRSSFYTIVPDGMRWGSTTDEAKYPYIVDTGTTMMHLPPPLTEAIAKAFDPPATYMYQYGLYFVDCKAIPPLFAVIIGGVEFYINSVDLIYHDIVDPMTGYCAVGFTNGGAGPYILGDVFLQNVVVVFDVGGAEMRFYERK